MVIRNSFETETEDRRAVWTKVCQDNDQLLRNIVGGRVRDHDLAHDIVTEAELKLLRLLPPPPPDEDGRRKYIFAVVKYQVFDQLKKRNLEVKRMISLDTSRRNEDDDVEVRPMDLADKGRSPEMNAEINEQRELLRKRSADLTEREKEMLELHLSGFNRQEIADALYEDVEVIRADLNGLIAKIRYRVRNLR